MSNVNSSNYLGQTKQDVVEANEPPMYYENLDLSNIITPIKVKKLEELLIKSGYPRDKTMFLIEGFSHGFDIGYEGPTIRADESDNIPLSIGNPTVLWNKIMKEVKVGHIAGPFKDIPFDNFMQSPIGLVPKAGNKARLIFHLSYEFKSGLGSLNSNMPKEKCSVRYWDLDYAIQACIDLMKQLQDNASIYYLKSDLVSAFRILPLKISNFKWLVLKAVDPKTGRACYFVDKCLLFGASISCALFQEFSNALQHITEFVINGNTKKILTNYVDDFLFWLQRSRLAMIML